jgi:hypothetical protein
VQPDPIGPVCSKINPSWSAPPNDALSLSRDHLTECIESGPDRHLSPALFVGQRSLNIQPWSVLRFQRSNCPKRKRGSQQWEPLFFYCEGYFLKVLFEDP